MILVGVIMKTDGWSVETKGAGWLGQLNVCTYVSAGDAYLLDSV